MPAKVECPSTEDKAHETRTEHTRDNSMLAEERLRYPGPHQEVKDDLARDLSFWVAVIFVVGSAVWVRIETRLKTLVYS